MLGDNLLKFSPAPKEEKRLSVDFKQITDLPLHFNNTEFERSVSSADQAIMLQVSEDLILSYLKTMITGEVYNRMISIVESELKKPVMQESTHRDLFDRVLKEVKKMPRK